MKNFESQRFFNFYNILNVNAVVAQVVKSKRRGKIVSEVMSLEVTPSEVTSLLSENFREYLLSSENSFRINLLKLSPQKLCPHAANSILKVESYIAET